jgi:acyl carrier protein
MISIQAPLKRYIESQFLFEAGEPSLLPGVDLLSQGILDSMGVLQVVAFIEDSFGVTIHDDEIIPDNFRSLDALTSLVLRKSGTKQ